jgi:hypothetical protein
VNALSHCGGRRGRWYTIVHSRHEGLGSSFCQLGLATGGLPPVLSASVESSRTIQRRFLWRGLYSCFLLVIFGGQEKRCSRNHREITFPMITSGYRSFPNSVPMTTCALQTTDRGWLPICDCRTTTVRGPKAPAFCIEGLVWYASPYSLHIKDRFAVRT